MWSLYTMEYYCPIKKDTLIISFKIDALETMILSEITPNLNTSWFLLEQKIEILIFCKREGPRNGRKMNWAKKGPNGIKMCYIHAQTPHLLINIKIRKQ